MWKALLVALLMASVPGAGAAQPLGTLPGPEDGTGRTGHERADGARANSSFSCVLKHVDASARLNETDHTLNASVTVQVETGRDTGYALLRVNRGMNITNITDTGFGVLTYKWGQGDFINISLCRTVTAGTKLSLVLDYWGEVLFSEDDNATYWGYIGPEGSWLRTYENYFPRDENLSLAGWRLSVEVPDCRTAVAPGDLVSVTNDTLNGTRTFVWEMTAKVDGIALVVGTFNHTVYQTNGHDYHIYFREEHNASAPAFAAEMQRIVDYYTALMGKPGFMNLSLVEVPSLFSAWGQTEPAMMWLASRNFGGELPYRILAHELGHQWWGIDVEGTGGGENWIQEGFAGYLEAMYEMATYHSRGFLDYCRLRYVNEFVNTGLDDPLAGNSYDLAATKGPWVLHMTRHLLGDELFNSTLKEFYSRNLHGRVDHLDYYRHLRDTADVNLTWFVNYWFYTAGQLDYGAQDALFLEGANGTHQVKARLVDRGRPSGMPLDVGLYDAGIRQATLRDIWNGTGGNLTIGYQTDLAVDEVVMDPDGWLLDVNLATALCTDATLDFWAKSAAVSPPEPLENERFNINLTMASASTMGPSKVTAQLFIEDIECGRTDVMLGAIGEVTVPFNESLPAGTYNLTALVDPQDEYFELNESNNRLQMVVVVRPPPPPLSDLVIVSVDAQPRNLTGGEPGNLTADIRNLANGTAAGFAVDFWVDSVDWGFVGRSVNVSAGPLEAVTASVSWTPEPGRHTVFARVDPAEGVHELNESNNDFSGPVDVNARPMAILSASPRELDTGEWVDFRGNMSTDDGTVSAFYFEYGDGEISGWLSEPVSSHRYLGKGTFVARLRVADNNGAESDWSSPVSIKVRDMPPVAAIQARPQTGNITTVFNFTSISTDPDGSVQRYLWNFGDGQSARSFSADHKYAYRGSFCVTLTVWDDADQSASASVVVSLRNIPPVAAILASKLVAYVGDSVDLTTGYCTDADDDTARLVYIWDLDGSPEEAQTVHVTLKRAGNFRVVLRVSDGNDTSEASLTIEVKAKPVRPVSAPYGWVVPVAVLALLAVLTLVAIYMLAPARLRRDDERKTSGSQARKVRKASGAKHRALDREEE